MALIRPIPSGDSGLKEVVVLLSGTGFTTTAMTCTKDGTTVFNASTDEYLSSISASGFTPKVDFKYYLERGSATDNTLKNATAGTLISISATSSDALQSIFRLVIVE